MGSNILYEHGPKSGVRCKAVCDTDETSGTEQSTLTARIIQRASEGMSVYNVWITVLLSQESWNYEGMDQSLSEGMEYRTTFCVDQSGYELLWPLLFLCVFFCLFFVVVFLLFFFFFSFLGGLNVTRNIQHESSVCILRKILTQTKQQQCRKPGGQAGR